MYILDKKALFFYLIVSKIYMDEDTDKDKIMSFHLDYLDNFI